MRRGRSRVILRDIADAVALRSRHASRWAAALLVLTAVGVVLSILWSVKARDVALADAAQREVWKDGLTGILPLGVAGAILIDRRPDLPFGWLLGMGVVGLVLTLAIAAPGFIAVEEGSTAALPRWAIAGGSGFWFFPETMKGLVNLRFPSGRPQSRRARGLEIAIIGGTVIGFVAGLLGSTAVSPDPDTPAGRAIGDLPNPLTGDTAVGHVADAFRIVTPIVVLLGLVAGIGVLVRWRRASGVERQQLTWRAVGVLIGLAFFPIAVSGGATYLTRIDIPFFVITLVVPVLRHQLWSIDTIIRRSVAYAVVIAVLIGVYAAVAAVGSELASERVGAGVAAVAVAIAFAPFRDRAQRLVDRIFYGDRADPYRALSELGKRLESVSPANVGPTIVDTTAESLRLPYTAIERVDGTTVTQHGLPGTSVERWPLTFEGAELGQLCASPRAGEEVLDRRDRELLADVARQAGVAFHAAALTNDLLVSRQRLVTAREEERRRLRRDLHDGLGPVLTAVGLNLDAARAQLTPAPSTADELIAEAREATNHAIDDLRRLVYGLRPPALDDLGLVGSLRAQVVRLGRGGDVQVDLRVDTLPTLPAAVEVAVFRTAIEALHNAVRHGSAKRCEMRLGIDTRWLVLEVRDDGCSTGPWVPGVGLSAMRERAEELGGTFSAGPLPVRGAVVESRFPLLEEP